MYFRMEGGTNRGFVFRSGNTNHSGIDASGNARFYGEVVAGTNGSQATVKARYNGTDSYHGALAGTTYSLVTTVLIESTPVVQVRRSP